MNDPRAGNYLEACKRTISKNTYHKPKVRAHRNLVELEQYWDLLEVIMVGTFVKLRQEFLSNRFMYQVDDSKSKMTFDYRKNQIGNKHTQALSNMSFDIKRWMTDHGQVSNLLHVARGQWFNMAIHFFSLIYHLSFLIFL